MHGRAVDSPGFCTMWGSAASGKQTIGTLKSSISGRNISWMNDKKIEDAWYWLKIAPQKCLIFNVRIFQMFEFSHQIFALF